MRPTQIASLLLALVLQTVVVSIAHAQTNVWIDTDLAIGTVGKDVDDGVALVQALRDDRLNVVGISTVFGNTTVQSATQKTKALLSLSSSHSISVYAGASQAYLKLKGDSNSAAVRAMKRYFAVHRGTLLLFGPVTNAATLWSLHPQVFKNIDAIYVLAGRSPGVEISVNGVQLSDLNFEKDPEAMRLLLQCGRPLHFCGFETTQNTSVDAKILAKWREIDSPLVQFLVRPVKRWILQWRIAFRRASFIPFDSHILLILLYPEWFRTVSVSASISEDAKRLTFKPVQTSSITFYSINSNGSQAKVQAWLKRSMQATKLY